MKEGEGCAEEGSMEDEDKMIREAEEDSIEQKKGRGHDRRLTAELIRVLQWYCFKFIWAQRSIFLIRWDNSFAVPNQQLPLVYGGADD